MAENVKKIRNLLIGLSFGKYSGFVYSEYSSWGELCLEF